MAMVENRGTWDLDAVVAFLGTAGGTPGPGMTFGFIAGRDAAQQRAV